MIRILRLSLLRSLRSKVMTVTAITLTAYMISFISKMLPAYGVPVGTVRFVKDFTQGELTQNSSGKIFVADLGSPLIINGRTYLLFGDNFESRAWGSPDALSGTHHPSVAIGYSSDPENVRLTGPALGVDNPLFDQGDYLGKTLPDFWQPQSNLPAGSIMIPDDQRTLILTNTVVNLTPIDSRFTLATESAPWGTVQFSHTYRPGLDIHAHYSAQQWIDMSDQPNSQISRSVYYGGAIYFFADGFKRRMPARLIRITKKKGATWIDSIIDRHNWHQIGQLSSDRVGEMDFMQLGSHEFAFTYYNASNSAIMLRIARTIKGLLHAHDIVIVKDAKWPSNAEQITFPVHEGNIAMAQCYGGYMASFDTSRRLLYIIISQWHTDGMTNTPYRSMIFSAAV